jgi:pimeloyl-ACP methyl ester carboxylesterase
VYGQWPPPGQGGLAATPPRCVALSSFSEHYIDVGGIRTHYLEAGSGDPLVLLHSGEFGGSAELCWERVLPGLADRFRVIAPDWLGYGKTDKLYDFAGGSVRRVKHMTEFLEAVGIDRAWFMGNSMGGSVLAQLAAEEEPVWNMDALVLISGGGFAPDNDQRRTLLNYDCTREGMGELLKTLFYDPSWALRDEYIERRYEESIQPGAWEAVAAARFKSPIVPPRSEFGSPDKTEYEKITPPTLIIAGRDDPLRLPNYAEELAARIPRSRVHVYEKCGHVPNLEIPDRTVKDIIQFFDDLEAGLIAEPAKTGASQVDRGTMR